MENMLGRVLRPDADGPLRDFFRRLASPSGQEHVEAFKHWLRREHSWRSLILEEAFLSPFGGEIFFRYRWAWPTSFQQMIEQIGGVEDVRSRHVFSSKEIRVMLEESPELTGSANFFFLRGGRWPRVIDARFWRHCMEDWEVQELSHADPREWGLQSRLYLKEVIPPAV